jgi:RsiW-degrading membrane proteinase PrsW (M82 family)
LATALLSLGLALVPALAWLGIYYSKDKIDPEPRKVIVQTFVWGCLSAAPFVGMKLILNAMPALTIGPRISMVWIATLVFPAMEELAKISSTIYVVQKNKKAFNQVIDGVMYGVTGALGFAFIENLFYFWGLFDQGITTQVLTIVAFRSFGTMLAHTIFSGIAGLIFAYAYFSKQITQFQEKGLLGFEFKDFLNQEIMTLHIVRKNILMAHPSRRGGHEKKILVLEGIFLATVLHIIFNITTTLNLFGENLTFLLVPALMGGFLYLSNAYAKKFYNHIYKVV